MAHPILDTLRSALLSLDKERALAATNAVLDSPDVDVQQGLDALGEALGEVGKLFQEGEWFLGELVYSGEIAKEAMGLLTPHLSAAGAGHLGKVVVGTVLGDMHDLGKNIFITYARGSGFEIIDLGTDVSPKRFADAVEEHRPLALGVSCLLTVTAGGIARVVDELSRRGLEHASKVIVGGAAITEEFARTSGADAFAPDAVTGAEIIRSWGNGS